MLGRHGSSVATPRRRGRVPCADSTAAAGAFALCAAVDEVERQRHHGQDDCDGDRDRKPDTRKREQRRPWSPSALDLVGGVAHRPRWSRRAIARAVLVTRVGHDANANPALDVARVNWRWRFAARRGGAGRCGRLRMRRPVQTAAHAARAQASVEAVTREDVAVQARIKEKEEVAKGTLLVTFDLLGQPALCKRRPGR